MTAERLNAWLSVGDRVCLWILVLGLAALFAWHDREAELNSPTLIAPACVTVPTKGAKP